MAEEFDCVDQFFEDGFVFECDAPILSDSPEAVDFCSSSLDSMDSWIGQIESMLMNDDDDRDRRVYLDSDQKLVSEFFADVLVDSPDGGSGSVDSVSAKGSDVPVVVSPTGGSGSGEIVVGKEFDVSDDPATNALAAMNDSGNENSEESPDAPELRNNDEEEADPVAKKRRRQIRNRDAAVRSRERKKIHLKDLETKSKYFEIECMRLGRLLQCLVAENQTLRHCLQNGGKAYDASITKQESAVLVWESLLLGSLLWYLWGIICQFPQPHLGSPLLLQATQVEASSDPGNVTPRGRGSSETLFTLPDGKCTVKGRKCKGSRPRMKPNLSIGIATLA